MNRFLNFVSGAVLGAIVGATLALMLAPESGQALRDQVKGQFERIQSEAKQAAADRRLELERELAELRAPRKP